LVASSQKRPVIGQQSLFSAQFSPLAEHFLLTHTFSPNIVPIHSSPEQQLIPRFTLQDSPASRQICPKAPSVKRKTERRIEIKSSKPFVFLL
jgi:hypothetical protein